MDGLQGEDHGGQLPLVVGDAPPPDVASAPVVGAPGVGCVLSDLSAEGVHGPALLLDGGGVDVGADVEGGLPPLPPVAGHHVATGSLQPHQLGP